MMNFETDLKSYIDRLKRIRKVPSYAVGFRHTIDALTYCADVFSGKIERSRDIIKCCENTLYEILHKQNEDSFMYKYDPVKAEKTAYFIETLNHVKGKWGAKGDKIHLEPWQCDIICNLFGWVGKESGFRRYTESYLEIPRKNGKSVLAAGVGLYMLLADGECGSEVYCGAKTRQQAMEVFKPSRLMLLRNEALIKKFSPEIKMESIELSDGSVFRPIIGIPLDGGSPNCSILDEIHQHPNGDLYESQQTGLGSRDQPLIFMITTAGYDLLSFCKQKHDEGLAAIHGTVPDDTLFCRIYSIDNEDIDLLGNPTESEDNKREAIRILRKANPNYGVSAKPEYLLEQCIKGFKHPTDRAKFLTKHLNYWVNAGCNYFDLVALKECVDPNLSIEDFYGDTCVIAVDLNSKLDLGCICVVFSRYIDDNIHYYAFPEFFLPEATVNDLSNKNFRYYQQFMDTANPNTSGGKVLNVSDGYETDYAEMTAIIGEMANRFHAKEIIFDSYNALQMEQECERTYGLNVVEFSKTTAYFSPPMKELSSAIISGRFHYDGNPCLGWNIGNVESKRDKNDNDFPRKANLRAENKIDGAICVLMAIARLMVIGQENDDDEHFREIYSDY